MFSQIGGGGDSTLHYYFVGNPWTVSNIMEMPTSKGHTLLYIYRSILYTYIDMRNKGSLSVLFFSFVSRAGVGNFVYAYVLRFIMRMLLCVCILYVHWFPFLPFSLSFPGLVVCCCCCVHVRWCRSFEYGRFVRATLSLSPVFILLRSVCIQGRKSPRCVAPATTNDNNN